MLVLKQSSARAAGTRAGVLRRSRLRAYPAAERKARRKRGLPPSAPCPTPDSSHPHLPSSVCSWALRLQMWEPKGLESTWRTEQTCPCEEGVWAASVLGGSRGAGRFSAATADVTSARRSVKMVRNCFTGHCERHITAPCPQSRHPKSLSASLCSAASRLVPDLFPVRAVGRGCSGDWTVERVCRQFWGFIS